MVRTPNLHFRGTDLSPVRELRSCKPSGKAKERKKEIRNK